MHCNGMQLPAHIVSAPIYTWEPRCPGLCLCLMLLTPPPNIVPDPPNMHCSRSAPWHPTPLTLNRNEQPIHIGVHSVLGIKTYVALEKDRNQSLLWPAKHFNIISISKIETYAGKELCSSCAISPQISLRGATLTSWTNTVQWS